MTTPFTCALAVVLAVVAAVAVASSNPSRFHRPAHVRQPIATSTLSRRESLS